MRREQICAKRAGLKRCEPRCRPGKVDVSRSFSLKHLPHENELATLAAVTNAIADHAFAEHGSNFWREVAHLVSMWKQNQIWFGAFDYLFQRHAIPIRSICLQ